MSIHDNLNSPLLKRVKANEEALNELQDGAGNPTKIATGTDVYIEDSAALPLIDLKLTGKSVQNGTPTLDAQISIHRSGDCVEMMQGAYGTTNGVYGTNTQYICSANSIPCASGDVINVSGENVEKAHVIFYNESGFVSALSATDTSTTTPSGATSFKINVYNSNGITPDTVGKISLTINGKYVVQIVENGKNQLDCRGLVATTTNGGTFEPIYDKDGLLMYVKVNGTFTSYTTYNLPITHLTDNTDYIVSGCPSGGTSATYLGVLLTNSGTEIVRDSGSGSVFNSSSGNSVIYRIRVSAGTYTNVLFYPMIRKADITDDTYEPYQETVATVLLDAPLCDTDVMSRTEVARNRVSVVFDGSDDENWQASMSLVGRYLILTNQPIKVGWDARGLCSQAILSAETKEINKFYITASGQVAINTNFSTLDEWKAHLQSNPMTVELEFTTPIIETLDSASQAALNAIETFNPITHITVDSRIKPEISVEYVHKAYESIVNSLIDRIESNSSAPDEWKLVGDVTGTTHITLPNDWKELSIRVLSSPRNATLYISRWMLEEYTGAKYFEIPLMTASERDVRLSIDTNEVYIWGVYNKGEQLGYDDTIITYMHTIVYYK